MQWIMRSWLSSVTTDEVWNLLFVQLTGFWKTFREFSHSTKNRKCRCKVCGYKNLNERYYPDGEGNVRYSVIRNLGMDLKLTRNIPYEACLAVKSICQNTCTPIQKNYSTSRSSRWRTILLLTRSGKALFARCQALGLACTATNPGCGTNNERSPFPR